MSTCRVHTDANGAWLQTPFIQEFIDDLKNQIPDRRRRWSKGLRMWWVDSDWVDTAVEIARRYYDRVEFAEVNHGRKRAPLPDPEPEQPDAWADLWLRPGAPPELVRAAYRTLAQIHHPDHGGDQETMKRLNQAYAEICEGGR